MTTIEVRRGDARFHTRVPGRDTRYAFSFGEHYDPARTGFGLLQACNEDRLSPGAGYAPHEHRGIEIVTWVLEGLLHHDDSYGHRAEVGPGGVQVLSAGSGVTHAEHASPGASVHLVQMWLDTEAQSAPPAYATSEVSGLLGTGEWVAVAGGRHQDAAAVSIRQPGACLRVARLAAGAQLPLPTAPAVYVHVARGRVHIQGCGGLATGDAALLTAAAGERVVSTGPAEVLAWEMQSVQQPGPGSRAAR